MKKIVTLFASVVLALGLMTAPAQAATADPKVRVLSSVCKANGNTVVRFNVATSTPRIVNYKFDARGLVGSSVGGGTLRVVGKKNRVRVVIRPGQTVRVNVFKGKTASGKVLKDFTRSALMCD